MLSLGGEGARSSESAHLGRRELLRVGGLSLTGLTLPALIDATAQAQAEPARERPRSFGKAKNCIVLYLSGGPPQHDLFDPKPGHAGRDSW